MNVIYDFSESGDFSGEYSSARNLLPSDNLDGSLCQPSNIIKLNYGTAWDSTASSISILDDKVILTSLSSSDWTADLRSEWVMSYIKHCGVSDYITSQEADDIEEYLDNHIDIFPKLSGASVAYISQNTSGVYLPQFDDEFWSGEIFLGLNSYPGDYLRMYADSLPVGNQLRNKIYTQHKNIMPYISHAVKLTYETQTEVVWAFGNIQYPLYTVVGTPDLETGGGNSFAEVRFAGSGLTAHYKLRKNTNPLDPTLGLCSGENGPFCIGDEIVIVEDSCYTENTTSGWTWVGDLSVIEREIYLADVSKPCEYYKNVPIEDMVFPLRIIQFCEFDDFN